MQSIYSLTFLLIIFAIGEVIAKKTKAIISTTLSISIILMVAFWMGLPVDVFDNSGINGIGMALVGMLIVSIGTMIDFKELKRQWKTVIISLVCLILGTIAILLICGPILGKEMAISGASIFSGGNTAALIMTQEFDAQGLTNISTFCILVLATDSFIGLPVSSFLLRKEAKRFISDKANIKAYSFDASVESSKRQRPLQPLFKGFTKPSAYLTKLGLIACLSLFVSTLIKGTVHYFVIALLMGILFYELGFLDKNILEKSKSSGFIVFATTIVIFSSLSKTTPQMIASMIIPLILTLIVGTIGVVIAGLITGKLLNVSPYLAIAFGMTCTSGFPTTMLMSQEIAEAIGASQEEKTAIENYIMPKMVTAGFVTITIASVIMAGILIKLI